MTTINSHYNNKIKTGGFTLLEMLVAIAILLIAVVGPMSLIADSLQQIYYARDQMIAINLAQEGIEMVRYVRDSNTLKPPPGSVRWDKDFGNGDCGPGAGFQCVADVYTLSIKKCNGSCQIKIYIDPSDGLYHQYDSTPPSSALATNFTRTIHTTNTSPDEYRVISTVRWTTGGRTGVITVDTTLFHWMP